MEKPEVVILCGGKGSRLSEETILKPKPMVEIGGRPILWHAMKIYSHYGYNKFILALGYRGEYWTRMGSDKPAIHHHSCSSARTAIVYLVLLLWAKHSEKEENSQCKRTRRSSVDWLMTS